MKILTLDGGGVFGIFQAHIIDNVDTSKFDMVIGTSIGSANGAVVANQIDVNLVNFFHEWMPKIFKKSMLKKIAPLPPRYSDKELNKSLLETFDSLTLGDSKVPLFINSVNMNTARLKVFASNDTADSIMPLWETVRCSVAAPTYLPPWKGYIDGGVTANNPSVVGVAAASSQLDWNLEDLEICSIGCGADNTDRRVNRYSNVSWGLWLLNTMLNGACNTMQDYIAKSLPVKKFVRIQPMKEKGWELDNVHAMFKAEELWAEDIKKGIDKVNEF